MHLETNSQYIPSISLVPYQNPSTHYLLYHVCTHKLCFFLFLRRKKNEELRELLGLEPVKFHDQKE